MDLGLQRVVLVGFCQEFDYLGPKDTKRLVAKTVLEAVGIFELLILIRSLQLLRSEVSYYLE
jgi:hypothetical protein